MKSLPFILSVLLLLPAAAHAATPEKWRLELFGKDTAASTAEKVAEQPAGEPVAEDEAAAAEESPDVVQAKPIETLKEDMAAGEDQADEEAEEEEATDESSNAAAGEPVTATLQTMDEAQKGDKKKKAPKPSVLQYIKSSPNHTILAKLLKGLPLAEALKDKDSDYTFFAPTDAAFRKLPPEYLKRLQRMNSVAEVQALLKYHMAKPGLITRDFEDIMYERRGKVVLDMMDGGLVIITRTGEGAWVLSDVRNSKTGIVTANHEEPNGVVHSIDAVLMPRK